MEVGLLPDILYQYRSNKTAFKIIEDKSIRLSDIRKSNDSTEMQLFFPDIFSAVIEQYEKEPFHITFEDTADSFAIQRLNYRNSSIINKNMCEGDFTNFVACFSENGDQLSQWRGYADDGNGCCLGYSRTLLEDYCKKNDNLLKLVKVEYITYEKVFEINRTINAPFILEKLRKNYEQLVQDVGEDGEKFSTFLGYYYWVTLKIVLNTSLNFKLTGFEEEKEWRIFLADKAYKNPEFVLNRFLPDKFDGNQLFIETTHFLRDRIKYQIKNNDIVAYLSMEHNDFSENPLVSLCTGPKNRASLADIKLFLANNDYKNIDIRKSQIPYC